VAAGGEHTVLLRAATSTTVSVGGDALVTVGVAASLTVTVSPAPAPGLQYTGSVVVDFGDGASQTLAVDAATGTATTSHIFSATGTRSVTASYAGSTDGAYRASSVSAAHSVEVVDGAPVSLDISPAAPAVVAGDPVTFVVTGDDALGADLGDVTADVSFTVDSVPFVNGSALTAAGTHTVTASLVSDPSVTVDAVVTVTPGEDAVILLTLDATTVGQGGQVTAAVTGDDAYGNDLGDLTDQVVLSSSHATDVISGRSIRFPHASVHTITATLATTAGPATSSVQITVVPAAIAETGVDPLGPLLGALALLVLGVGLAAGRRIAAAH
jgi:hypothetical protein